MVRKILESMRFDPKFHTIFDPTILSSKWQSLFAAQNQCFGSK